jgi:hypothetical protein
MIRNDMTGMADMAEALEEEIVALTRLDPYDPQIYVLHERLNAVVHNMYAEMPRGV